MYAHQASVRTQCRGLRSAGEGARVLAFWHGDGAWHRATVDAVGQGRSATDEHTYWVQWVLLHPRALVLSVA